MQKHTILKPSLGIALILTHTNRILLGRRLKQPQSGSWQLPGGWLHYAETPEQAVIRKAGEYPGLQCSPAKFVTYTDNQFDNGLHSVSLYFKAQCLNAQDINLNDNKHCSDWFWADWYDLPHPLFQPLLQLKQSGIEPFIR